MLSFADRRTLRAAQSVSTDVLARDLQAAVAAAARVLTETAEMTNVVSADFEVGEVTEERHAAFRTFAALATASFQRLADDAARMNARLSSAL